MTTHIVSALYDSQSDAEAACRSLCSLGLSSSDIDIHRQDGEGGHHHEGFFASLKEMFGMEDGDAYAEGVRRGHYLLAARVPDGCVEQAMDVLEDSNAVDLEGRQQEWRESGWQGTDSSMGTGGSMGTDGAARAGFSADTDGTSAANTRSTESVASNAGRSSAALDRTGAAGRQEEVIPVVEEQLRVGKRDVNRGGVRVRSHIVEEPVNEQVNLREEHVRVERRPVNEPADNREDLLRDRTIELTETAEEAVVAKDAVVREEVTISKDVDEKTENIQDTVRRTKVDVEDTRTGRAGSKRP